MGFGWEVGYRRAIERFRVTKGHVPHGSAQCPAFATVLWAHCLWQWDETAWLLLGEFQVLIYAFREIFLYALCNL